MIGFIDDSGDCGDRFTSGASQYFVLVLICLKEKIAFNGDKEIDKLRIKHRYKTSFEFHFKDNTHNQRIVFLEYLRQMPFSVYGIVLDKHSNHFPDKNKIILTSMLELLAMVDKHIFPYKITLDEMFGKKQLITIRKKLKVEYPELRKVQEEKSFNNNLIQVADYYAGCLNRFIQGKDQKGYFDYLRIKQKRILIK